VSGKEKPVIIIGGSGHARVLIDCLQLMGREIVGLLDPGIAKGKTIAGVSVMGADDVLLEFSPDRIEIVNGIGVLPGRRTRWLLGDSVREKGYTCASVVHPSVIISSNVSLESGVQVMAGCVLQNGITVGYDSVINTGSSIDHDSAIDAQCWISPGVTICGEVNVGPGAYIGAGATILQKVSIKEGSLVRGGETIVEEVGSV